MFLSVIIPTFNGERLLKKSLFYLEKSIEKLIKKEVILVDNGSTDATENFIKKNYPTINYLKLDQNYGFAKAINTGAKKAKGRYLLFLNNDCFLKKDTVKKMIEFLEKNKEYVATQPVVYNIKDKMLKIEDKEPLDKQFTKGEVGYLVELGKGKAEVIHNSEFRAQNKKEKDRYVYGLSASCLLIRKEVFEKIGMFDESFHSYLEDVDLFIRLAKRGYQYYPTLSTSCFHLSLSTSRKMGSYKQRQDLKNWIRIILKNYSLRFILKHFPGLFIERLRNLSGLIKKLL